MVGTGSSGPGVAPGVGVAVGVGVGVGRAQVVDSTRPSQTTVSSTAFPGPMSRGRLWACPVQVAEVQMLDPPEVMRAVNVPVPASRRQGTLPVFVTVAPTLSPAPAGTVSGTLSVAPRALAEQASGTG
ncbi:hypothetical protein C3V41_06390 [Actinomyces sp. oral taxon 897]|nr:hypothetical protein C3V41_06390 [Actinomyces sp. oral taxon 897]